MGRGFRRESESGGLQVAGEDSKVGGVVSSFQN